MNLKTNFKNFDYYIVRWVLFGAIGGLLTPVLEPEHAFWTIKSYQIISGLISGLICAVIFTPVQNNLNKEKSKFKTWAFVILIWCTSSNII